MQQYVETEGKTTEEALEHALEKLDVSREQVSVKVIHEATKGILGLGTKLAKIRATVKGDISPTPESVLHDLLTHMGVEAEIETRSIDDNVHLIVSADTPGLLIGRHGQTLNAIEYLVNCILNKSSLVKKRVFVDTEGYRERRETLLVDLANRTAAKVKESNLEVVLNPMTPQDRRIVHLALQSDNGVATYSRGEGMLRCVVVTPHENHDP
ncbi:MAG: protein jag [Candidatus Poribacteria bacterium]|nr:protein jag [Candidatus Poribacteria bacterium]